MKKAGLAWFLVLAAWVGLTVYSVVLTTFPDAGVHTFAPQSANGNQN